MGKEKPYVFQNQLKTISSIEAKINELRELHKTLKSGLPAAMFRTTIEPHSPTTYMTESLGRKKVIFGDEKKRGGIKDGDSLLSETNPDWVVPSDKYGLSFASTFNQTKFTLGR
ncbi:hypothetical protein R50072_12160 [Simiduia litorea]|uniref:hypothetical protein n=1 Tax=Simiduia litorea TaxID=1435348 RepID=UPI0036F44E77